MKSSRCRLSQAAYRSLGRTLPEGPWSDALHWVQWAMPVFPDVPWVTLGLDAALPARYWPLGLKLSGSELVPVRCLPVSSDPLAQAWIRTRNDANDFGNGTLGGFVRSRGPSVSLSALTAGHVLAGSGTAHSLDPVSFRIGDDVLGEGRLHDWVPAFDTTGRDCALDAGTVHLDPALGAGLLARSALPVGWSDVASNQPLVLMTRGTRLAARAVGMLSTFMRVGDNDELKYRLVDGLCYQVEGGSAGGDSGAPVWDQHDRLVGIHTGAAPDGAAGNAIATPIGRVLRWFGVDLVIRSGVSNVVPAPSATLTVLAPPGAASAPVRESDHATDVLARTMWGEARGDGVEGMAAVAHVVLNRRDAQRWWGRSIDAVCLKPFQFSCWNDGDPNRGPLLAVRSSNAVFAAALRIADELASMPVGTRVRADPTSGATHYHAHRLRPLPKWARDQVPCARIGRHLFYRVD